MIYLASTICLVGVALCAYTLARRVARLSKDLNNLGLLLDKLNKSNDIHRQAIAALTERLNDQPLPAFPDGNAGKPRAAVSLAELRAEIESLVTDLDEEKRPEVTALRRVEG